MFPGGRRGAWVSHMCNVHAFTCTPLHVHSAVCAQSSPQHPLVIVSTLRSAPSHLAVATLEFERGSLRLVPGTFGRVSDDKNAVKGLTPTQIQVLRAFETADEEQKGHELGSHVDFVLSKVPDITQQDLR